MFIRKREGKENCQLLSGNFMKYSGSQQILEATDNFLKNDCLEGGGKSW
jgi:hypothetical protein